MDKAMDCNSMITGSNPVGIFDSRIMRRCEKWNHDCLPAVITTITELSDTEVMIYGNKKVFALDGRIFRNRKQ